MEKKKIKILTSGPIRVKGFINGPVLTPYFETTSTIFSMLSANVKIVEVCDDGVEIALTTSNFTEDNSKVARETREKNNINTVEPKAENKADSEVMTEDVEAEEKTEEKIEIQKPTYNKPYQNQNNKYQNKNNKYNKNYQVHTEPASIDLTDK